MLVLALDSSTPVLTAGVAEVTAPGAAVTVLAERTLTDAFAHAEQLMPLVQAALAAAGRSLHEVGTVVVGLGPGPFTGLRVGIATGAALADGLAVSAHGVGSHDGLAAGLPGTVLVVTDARRREVYVSVHRGGATVAGPEPVAPAAVPDWLTAHDVTPEAMTGPGVLLLDGLLPVCAPALPLTAGLIGAADLAAPPTPLSPLYLRRPDATEPSSVRKSVLGR
ncbi:MAG: tRNA (adenosine(37)-N6)-threonylcarbamoyltransferase complex dimerization subunit type 1 TsaB [Nakamurella sp.]